MEQAYGSFIKCPRGREAALASCRAHILICSRFLQSCTKDELEYLEVGYQVLVDHIDDISSNAYYIPRHDDPTVESWMMQFADQVSSGSDQHSLFLCRRKECLWTARSIDWLNNVPVGKGGYWCPMCIRRYHAGCSTTNVVKANKLMCSLRHANVVLTMDDKIEGEYEGAGHGVITPALAGRWEGPTDATSVKDWDIQPYMWLDTPLQQLQDRFAVVANGMLQELRDIPTPRGRLQYILSKADNANVPSFFKRIFPTPEQLVEAERVNCTRDAAKGFDLDRFEHEGWLGVDLKFMEKALDEPATQEELASQYFAGRLHVQALLENARWAKKRR